MENTGTVFNIQHFSLHDGPGIRTVVFLKGCPLDCIWCHNPESKAFSPQLLFSKEKCVNCGKCAQVCPHACHITGDERKFNRENCINCGKCADVCAADALILSGKEQTTAEIMAEISKDDIFFGDDGGVTFSGGEPFSQPKFLLGLLKACKEKGYSTCVETSGYANGYDISECAKYIDIFLYDCKETDEKRHLEFTGKGLCRILKNLNILENLKATVILRCPIIPNCNDYREHFENIGKLAEKLNCIKAVELLPYHPLGINKQKQLGTTPAYSEEKFLDKETAKDYAEVIKKFTAKSVSVSGE